MLRCRRDTPIWGWGFLTSDHLCARFPSSPESVPRSLCFSSTHWLHQTDYFLLFSSLSEATQAFLIRDNSRSVSYARSYRD